LSPVNIKLLLIFNCNNTIVCHVVLLDAERAGDGQRVKGGVARRRHGAGDGGDVPGGVDAIRRLRPDRGLWGPDPDHPGDGRAACTHGQKFHLLQPHHLRRPQHAGRLLNHTFFSQLFNVYKRVPPASKIKFSSMFHQFKFTYFSSENFTYIKSLINLHVCYRALDFAKCVLNRVAQLQ
jgi:hypothetical protein